MFAAMRLLRGFQVLEWVEACSRLLSFQCTSPAPFLLLAIGTWRGLML